MIACRVSAIASSVLRAEPYLVAQERWEQPPRLVDRVAWQVPYGHDGRVLRVEHTLSSDGIAWAQTLGDTPLVGDIPGLRLTDAVPVYA